MRVAILHREGERYNPFRNHAQKLFLESTDGTDTITAVGNVYSGSIRKWEGIINGGNGYIYALPSSNFPFLKIETATDTITEIPLTVAAGNDFWKGGVIYKDRYIYLVNSNSGNILKFDIVTETMSTFGSPSIKYIAPIIDGDTLIGFPQNGNKILKINLLDDSITEPVVFGGTASIFSSQLGPNGFVYLIPYNDANFWKFDLANDTAVSIATMAGIKKYISSAIYPDGCIYAMPNEATAIAKIDPRTDTVTTIGSLGAGAKWGGTTVMPSGIIYGIPNQTTNFIKFNPETEVISYVGNIAGVNKFITACVSEEGDLWLAAYRSPQMYKVDNDGITDGFDVEYLMSRYINKD